jgi:poly-beta-hydroxyalkanoate depolymerase
MWYAVVEQQREWMRAWRAATRHAFDVWPAATLPHSASTCYDDLFEPLLGPAAGPPRFELREPGIDERIVAHTPFCQLRRFAQAGTRRTVLLCAPLAGHAAVMMRETVEALLADGDVCVTDWVNARDVPLAAGRFGSTSTWRRSTASSTRSRATPGRCTSSPYARRRCPRSARSRCAPRAACRRPRASR